MNICQTSKAIRRVVLKNVKMINQLIRYLLTISLILFATAIGAAETTFFSTAAWPFKPDWNSLANYRPPEWFRDAKFGIRAHWGSQCYREQEWQSDVERAALARRPAGHG